ncbi:hypothetical protein QAD02_016267 [Eretmocerus hayati]|uniref:Uncharacterized protein n=1 Tax=Eretmocerus hayati TaxID=131215 RepID=A0ACC2PAP6_9HYME|nr:hypothetical protein QAD02_016267 [Eretmocerus hayati]
MDSHQQQFCLKWNSFGSNLATAFSNLFKSESLTDVTLFCEGVTFKAHRLILAACSKHFQELFEGMPPSPAGLIVILDGTSAHNMAALLEFMYRGEVHVGQESLSSFLKAAECLQVKELLLQTSGGAGLAHQEPLLAGGPLNGPVALDRGIKRRRTPTPAPPSPHAPTYSLPNVYSSATHFYDSPQKRLMRSPSDVDSLARASVLRDGAAFRPASAPHPLLLENHLYQFGGHPSAPDTPTHPHTAPHTPTELEREVIKREHSEEREHNGETKEGVAEDLRIKTEPVMSERERMEKLAERLSSESYSRSSFDSGNYVNSTEHIERQQREQREQREREIHREHQQHREQLHREQREREHREQQQQQINANNVGPMGLAMGVMPPVHPPTPDLSPAPAAPATWNSKLNKAGTVTTPDGIERRPASSDTSASLQALLQASLEASSLIGANVVDVTRMIAPAQYKIDFDASKAQFLKVIARRHLTRP